VTPPKKIEAAVWSDRSLFDHNREIMKQAFLFMKPFAAPGAFTPQQAPSEWSLSSLDTFPPSPVSERASKEGGFRSRGRLWRFADHLSNSLL
jgi:hypothetical protein